MNRNIFTLLIVIISCDKDPTSSSISGTAYKISQQLNYYNDDCSGEPTVNNGICTVDIETSDLSSYQQALAYGLACGFAEGETPCNEIDNCKYVPLSNLYSAWSFTLQDDSTFIRKIPSYCEGSEGLITSQSLCEQIHSLGSTNVWKDAQSIAGTLISTTNGLTDSEGSIFIRDGDDLIEQITSDIDGEGSCKGVVWIPQ